MTIGNCSHLRQSTAFFCFVTLDRQNSRLIGNTERSHRNSKVLETKLPYRTRTVERKHCKNLDSEAVACPRRNDAIDGGSQRIRSIWLAQEQTIFEA